MNNRSIAWPAKVFVHIVTFNNADTISACLDSLLNQDSYVFNQSLVIKVTDNDSSDSTVQLLQKRFPQIEVALNSCNVGFCAAHNVGAHSFILSDCSYFLVLNPDLWLEPDALIKMVTAFQSDSKIGSVTPLLLRCSHDLKKLEPGVIDAAGMCLTPALRHFDRGSGTVAVERYLKREDVFGGTGACLMLRREFVEDVKLETARESDLLKVHPEYTSITAKRFPVFDEAFFAFREDADLAWRGQLLGWRCLYEPSAVGYHRRTVLPENRKQLPDFLNRLGVRNRFLLQINNYSVLNCPGGFWRGMIGRNIVVLLGIVLWEWSSIPALVDLKKLAGRALARRRCLLDKLIKVKQVKIELTDL